jgi:hypothetical protein
MKAHVLTILLALLLAGTAAGPAQAVVIDFEGLPNGENAGNVLAASGVTFATGTIPNVLTPTITFTPVSASFDVFNPNICAISGTACSLAHLGGTNDLLMSFSTPVTGVLPDEKLLTEMGKYNEELVNSGVMLAGEGLQPSSKGARVTFNRGKRIVTDRFLRLMYGLASIK